MKWVLFVAMMVATVAAYQVAPAKDFPQPELARIIFFHLPCAYATAGFSIFASIASWRYLAKREWIWEYRAHAATEMALTLGCATMLTGILFSKVQWGAWWHWDARQTSFLIVLLLLGAYFAIRMAFEEEVSRARVSAAYRVPEAAPSGQELAAPAGSRRQGSLHAGLLVGRADRVRARVVHRDLALQDARSHVRSRAIVEG
jgi:heme exporter protein C